MSMLLEKFKEYVSEHGYELVISKENGISVPEILDGIVCDPDVSEDE